MVTACIEERAIRQPGSVTDSRDDLGRAYSVMNAG
jgi:hypothetical protein